MELMRKMIGTGLVGSLALLAAGSALVAGYKDNSSITGDGSQLVESVKELELYPGEILPNEPLPWEPSPKPEPVWDASLYQGERIYLAQQESLMCHIRDFELGGGGGGNSDAADLGNPMDTGIGRPDY